MSSVRVEMVVATDNHPVRRPYAEEKTGCSRTAYRDAHAVSDDAASATNARRRALVTVAPHTHVTASETHTRTWGYTGEGAARLEPSTMADAIRSV